MRRKRRSRPPDYEIGFVPSEPGLPPNDLHPYRDLEEGAREALLIEVAVRILRDCESSSSKGQALKIPIN